MCRGRKGIAQIKEGNLISPQAFNAVNAVQRYAAMNPLESLSKEKKIELLHLVDRTARAEDPSSHPCFRRIKFDL